MVVSERQQDPPSYPLLVPSKLGQIMLLIRKSLEVILIYHVKIYKKNSMSINLNKLAHIPLLYHILIHGASSLLLVLRC